MRGATCSCCLHPCAEVACCCYWPGHVWATTMNLKLCRVRLGQQPSKGRAAQRPLITSGRYGCSRAQPGAHFQVQEGQGQLAVQVSPRVQQQQQHAQMQPPLHRREQQGHTSMNRNIAQQVQVKAQVHKRRQGGHVHIVHSVQPAHKQTQVGQQVVQTVLRGWALPSCHDRS